MYSNADLERLAHRYLRLRYALPPGTRFYDFLQCHRYYEAYALKRLRNWHENPRIASLAYHSPITLN